MAVTTGWMAWRPSIPRWFPQDGPVAPGPNDANLMIIDYGDWEMLAHFAVAMQWIVVVLLAPFTLLVRLVLGRSKWR